MNRRLSLALIIAGALVGTLALNGTDGTGQISEPNSGTTKRSPDKRLSHVTQISDTSTDPVEISQDVLTDKTLSATAPKESEARQTDDTQLDTETFVRSGDPLALLKIYAQQRKVRGRLLQEKLGREPVDDQWGEQIRQRFGFAGSIIPALAATELTLVDCRSTLCAVHLSYINADPQQLKTYLGHVGTVLGTEAWFHHDAFPNGGIVYLAKSNSRLPDIL